MTDFIQTPRVVVICDRALERQLLDEFVKLGIKGWTNAHCNGKGIHAILEDPFAEPEHSRVRIEMVTTPATAEAVMRHVESAPYHRRGVFAYMDNVFVSSRRRFD